MKCILLVAAFDNGGGAGLLQDVRTAEAHGIRAVTAVTGLTVQDDTGVREIASVPPDFLRRQMELMLASYPMAAVKLGALCSGEQARVVTEVLSHFPRGRTVWDPVFAATSGGEFLPGEQLRDTLEILLPRVGLLTPNLPELTRIAGLLGITGKKPPVLAGELSRRYGMGVYVKGGHGIARFLREWLVLPGWLQERRKTRLELRYLHGTGCMFATATACGIARRLPYREACVRAADFTARHYRRINEAGFGANEAQPVAHER